MTIPQTGKRMLTERTISQFLDELASSSPAPGGGSVAALAGAAGAALASMVCNLTVGKKKYSDVQAEISALLQETEKLRKELTLLIDKDAEAFNTVMAAFSLPKGTEQEQGVRTAAIQEATKSATLIPLQVMAVCHRALRYSLTVAEKGNKNSASDAGVAALMLQAGCSGVALNVRINLNGLSDTEFVQKTTQSYKEVLRDVDDLARKVLAAAEMSIGVN